MTAPLRLPAAAPVYFIVFSVLVLAAGPAWLRSAEVIEVGREQLAELPGGKESDGIVGDFVLRNDRIEAAISGSLPLRRPNMSTFYGEGNETPGCLYDLTRRGADNDQITIFTPSGQRGPVSYVKIAEDLGEGRAGVETYVSAARAKDGAVSRRHLYLLEDGWDGVLVVTTLTNEGGEEAAIDLRDHWTQMREKGIFKGIQWADAIDPADKCGYAFAWVKEEGATVPKSSQVKLAPGSGITVARFLAVGRSPAEAVGLVERRRDPGAAGPFRAVLQDGKGEAVTTGRLLFTLGDEKPLAAYPDDEGRVGIFHLVGEHRVRAEDVGREARELSVTVEAGAKKSAEADETGPEPATVTFGEQAAVEFAITDGEGADIPCKAQFNARKGTPAPNLGPDDRAHGCIDQWHSETGTFRVPLPPGEYRIVVTHGPEHHHLHRDIELKPGGTVKVAGALERAVSTPGWVSTDFHNHSTPSGDNVCGTDDRIINLAAEQIEFAPTTEHNRLYDWAPHIEKLGLNEEIGTVPGLELTGRGAHLNAFPFQPDPSAQDGGAPVWQPDPRINAMVLRDHQGREQDRWVHVNHPDMAENFVDRDGDGRADGGFAYFGKFIDGLETQNYRTSAILSGEPFSLRKSRTGIGRRVNYHREFIWLQLLNQGLDAKAIAVNDAHRVHGNGAGGWRTWVKSSTDDPAAVDWREISRNAKAGRMILSNGPYLEVATGAGVEAGGHDRVSGLLELDVRVQCSDWLDIDRVQVLVNGRQDPRYNYTREANAEMFGDGVVKFDHRLELDLGEDAHLIVVAAGEGHSLRTGFGSSAQSEMQPIAYNNPIFIDVDGNGFQPNGDTLGYELPVRGLKVDEVEELLGK